nr:MAG TPA: hypothetical protein [Caudoviricetes sp.]
MTSTNRAATAWIRGAYSLKKGKKLDGYTP